MVTPAINRYDRINRDVTQVYTGGTTPIVTVTPSLWRYGFQKRPESTSNRRRSDGTRPPSPWENSWARASAPVADIYGLHWESSTRIYGATSCAPYDAILPSGFTDRLYNEALLQALTNLKGSKVNLGTMLAEARETAELLGSTAERIAKSIDAWRRRRPGDLKKWSRRGWKGVPQSYLENCYGWTPMLGDVYNSAEALADAWHGSGLQPQFTVAGRARNKAERKLVWGSQFAGMSDEYKGMEEESCHVVLCSILPKYLLAPLVQTGMTNPFEVLWERKPLSFVVDWVYPVGDWLHVLDAGAYTTFREGSVSRVKRYSGTVTTLASNSPLWVVVPTTPGRFDSGRFRREVLYSLPVIPPLPSLKNPLGLTRMAQGLSLLTQAFKRLEIPANVMDKIPRYVWK